MIMWMFLSFHSVLCDQSPDQEKRLLLNDPDVMLGQIHALERKLQEVNTKMSSLETESKNQIATLKALITQKDTDGKIQLSALQATVDALKTQKGVVHMRWGRKDCPSLNGTELVYSGLAGGSSYGHTGSGTNNLCLPHDPNMSPLSSSLSPYSNEFAYVYGAEYQFSYLNVKLDDDVPCAVCLDIKATTVMTVPGKSVCPQGWRKQYDGLLSSSYYNHAGASEYSCVDGNPQYFEGRRANNDGRLFYPTKSVCGSLPCPPYENDRYMRCAVCSK